jgi:hypothetical protein
MNKVNKNNTVHLSDDPLSRRVHAKQEKLILYANTGEKMFAEVPELIRAWPGNGVYPEK